MSASQLWQMLKNMPKLRLLEITGPRGFDPRTCSFFETRVERQNPGVWLGAASAK
jgi:hypothetical protein